MKRKRKAKRRKRRKRKRMMGDGAMKRTGRGRRTGKEEERLQDDGQWSDEDEE